jgi:hypothetical protein
LRLVAAKAARANEYHQGKRNYPLLLIYALIKSQRSGTRLLGDLDEPTASVLAIESEVFGSCVEDICISCIAQEWRCLALLRMEVFEVYLGGKSGSKSAVEVSGLCQVSEAFWALWK